MLGRKKRLAALAVLSLIYGTPAVSAEKITQLPPLTDNTISARYSVHWGLLRLAELDLRWTLRKDDYTVDMDARTRGIIRAVFKAESSLTASGAREKDALRPARFSTQSQFNSKAFARDMAFTTSGNATITRAVKPEDFEIEREPIPAELQKGPDPLSAFLMTLLAPSDMQGQRSYDGVQVLESNLECGDTPEALKKTKRSVFYGMAQQCALMGDVIAGDIIEEDDSDKEEVDGRDFQTALWFARTADEVLRLPVRVIAQSERGTLKIYLREVGQTLSR